MKRFSKGILRIWKKISCFADFPLPHKLVNGDWKGGRNEGKEDVYIARAMVLQESCSCFHFCEMKHAVL